jgi:hypothetical protein
MKNKLFLSLSILTAAFALNADVNQQPGYLSRAKTGVVNGAKATKNAVVNGAKATKNGIVTGANVAYTSSTQDLVKASTDAAVNGYNSTKTYVLENPKKSAAIGSGLTALTVAGIVAYKKGYLRNPFKKAAKQVVATPAVKAVAAPAPKKAKKAKRVLRRRK